MQAPRALTEAYLERHPHEAAARLETFDTVEAAALLATVPAERAAAALERMATAAAAAILGHLDDAVAVPVLAALSVHAAGTLLRRLPQARREALMQAIPESMATAVARLLRFGERTAGGLVDPFAAALPADVQAAGALDHVRAHPERVAQDLLVVARDGTLRGAVPLAALIAASPSATLGELARPVPVSFAASTDITTLADSPAWTAARAVPVVDAGGRLLGALRAEAIEAIVGRGSAGAAAPATLLHVNELIWSGSTRVFGELADALLPRGPAGGPR
jgi:Mg/Co/Ni transporter MgtE